MLENKYKSVRIIDGKSKWVIVDKYETILNKNPKKEELKLLTFTKYYKKGATRSIYHNETETCDRCGISFDKATGNPRKECDIYGEWTGKWDCKNCHEKYDPNSNHNIKKSMTNCRNKNLDPDSNHGIGYISTVLVKKFLGIEDCFDETNNFNYPEQDLVRHEKFGLINVKGATLKYRESMPCHYFHTNRNMEVDYIFGVGFDENRKHVIVMYKIPNDVDISQLGGIQINYNRHKYSKYGKFKVIEEEIAQLDNIYHTLNLDNCSVLRKRK